MPGERKTYSVGSILDEMYGPMDQQEAEQEEPFVPKRKMREGWLPFLGALGTRVGTGIASGALSAVPTPLTLAGAAAIAGAGEAGAQKIESSDPINPRAVLLETGLGAVPFGKFLKAVKPGITSTGTKLANAGRMAAMIEASNMLRRKEASDHWLPQSPMEWAFDVGTMGVGAGMANIHPKLSNVPEDSPDVKARVGRFADAIEQQTVAGREPVLVRHKPNKDINKQQGGGGEIPLSRSKKSPIVATEPQTDTQGGRYQTRRTGKPVGMQVRPAAPKAPRPGIDVKGRSVTAPMTGEIDPKTGEIIPGTVRRDDLAYGQFVDQRGTRDYPNFPIELQERLRLIDERPYSNRLVQLLDEEGKPTTDLARKLMAHEHEAKELQKRQLINKYQRSLEAEAKKAVGVEQRANLEDTRKTEGGTNLRDVQAKEGAQQTRNDKARQAYERTITKAHAAADKDQKAATAIDNAIKEGNLTQPRNIVTETATADTGTGKQQLRTIYTAPAAEGGDDVGKGGNKPITDTVNRDPRGKVTIPASDFNTVSKQTYGSEKAAMQAAMGTGRRVKEIAYISKGRWQIIFEGQENTALPTSKVPMPKAETPKAAEPAPVPKATDTPAASENRFPLPEPRANTDEAYTAAAKSVGQPIATDRQLVERTARRGKDIGPPAGMAERRVNPDRRALPVEQPKPAAPATPAKPAETPVTPPPAKTPQAAGKALDEKLKDNKPYQDAKAKFKAESEKHRATVMQKAEEVQAAIAAPQTPKGAIPVAAKGKATPAPAKPPVEAPEPPKQAPNRVSKMTKLEREAVGKDTVQDWTPVELKEARIRFPNDKRLMTIVDGEVARRKAGPVAEPQKALSDKTPTAKPVETPKKPEVNRDVVDAKKADAAAKKAEGKQGDTKIGLNDAKSSQSFSYSRTSNGKKINVSYDKDTNRFYVEVDGKSVDKAFYSRAAAEEYIGKNVTSGNTPPSGSMAARTQKTSDGRYALWQRHDGVWVIEDTKKNRVVGIDKSKDVLDKQFEALEAKNVKPESKAAAPVAPKPAPEAPKAAEPTKAPVDDPVAKHPRGATIRAYGSEGQVLTHGPMGVRVKFISGRMAKEQGSKGYFDVDPKHIESTTVPARLAEMQDATRKEVAGWSNAELDDAVTRGKDKGLREAAEAELAERAKKRGAGPIAAKAPDQPTKAAEPGKAPKVTLDAEDKAALKDYKAVTEPDPVKEAVSKQNLKVARSYVHEKAAGEEVKAKLEAAGWTDVVVSAREKGDAYQVLGNPPKVKPAPAPTASKVKLDGVKNAKGVKSAVAGSLKKELETAEDAVRVEANGDSIMVNGEEVATVSKRRSSDADPELKWNEEISAAAGKGELPTLSGGTKAEAIKEAVEKVRGWWLARNGVASVRVELPNGFSITVPKDKATIQAAIRKIEKGSDDLWNGVVDTKKVPGEIPDEFDWPWGKPGSKSKYTAEEVSSEAFQNQGDVVDALAGYVQKLKYSTDTPTEPLKVKLPNGFEMTVPPDADRAQALLDKLEKEPLSTWATKETRPKEAVIPVKYGTGFGSKDGAAPTIKISLDPIGPKPEPPTGGGKAPKGKKSKGGLRVKGEAKQAGPLGGKPETVAKITEAKAGEGTPKLVDMAAREKDAWDKYFDLKNSGADKAEVRAAAEEAGRLKAESLQAVREAMEKGEPIPTFMQPHVEQLKKQTAKAEAKKPVLPPGKGPTSDDIVRMDPAQQQAAIEKEVANFKGKMKPKKGEGGTTIGMGLGGFQELLEKHPDFAVKMGTTVAGMLAGAAATPDDPLTGALLGGGAGLGGTALFRAVRNHINTLPASQRKTSEALLGKWTKERIKLYADVLPDAYRASLLSNPLSLGINSLIGPWGAGIMGAIERSIAGDPRGLTALKKVMKFPLEYAKEETRNEAMRRVRASNERGDLTGPKLPGRLQRAIEFPATKMTTGDIAIRNLLMESGFSEREARQLTLTSEPYSQSISDFARGKENTKTMMFAKRMMLPFFRTSQNQLEQSLLRAPVLGFLAENVLGNAPRSMSLKLAQQGVGAGVMGVSYYMGTITPPERRSVAMKFLMNFGGPYGALAAAGFAAGYKSQTEPDRVKQVTAGLTEVMGNTPLPTMDAIGAAGKAAVQTLAVPMKLLDGTMSEKDIPDLPYGFIPPLLSSKEKISVPTALRDPKGVFTEYSKVRPTQKEYTVFAPLVDDPELKDLPKSEAERARDRKALERRQRRAGNPEARENRRKRLKELRNRRRQAELERE
jgi:hypothetical protein